MSNVKACLKNIFSNEKLHLPYSWDDKDFIKSLEEMFELYLLSIEKYSFNILNKGEINQIKKVTNLILNVVKEYLNGFPSKAFKNFEELMEILGTHELKTYKKSIIEHFEEPLSNFALKLYRIVRIDKNSVEYVRSRVFHAPYSIRKKISNYRYSIAGFPSLYLSTSLKLCCQETSCKSNDNFIASRFEMNQNYEDHHIDIRVIELGVKPQDFLNNNATSMRRISQKIKNDSVFCKSYLFWYPLIAACSFIKNDTNSKFYCEYILPQMLMQWARLNSITVSSNSKSLIGIRYFSCASKEASEYGFNYVFPTSGQQNNNLFCNTLTKIFRLTKPCAIKDFCCINACEQHINNDIDLDFIEQ